MRAIAVLIMWYLMIVIQVAFINTFEGGSIIGLPLMLTLFLNWKFPQPRTLWWTTLGMYLTGFFDGTPFVISILLVSALAFLTQYLVLNVLTHRTTVSAIISLIVGLVLYDAFLILFFLYGHAALLGSWLTLPTATYLILQCVVGALLAALANVIFKRYETKQISLLV